MSMAKITHIVVHYSATFEDQNLTRDDIDAMHKARGWRKVGYHYVIRRSGLVEVGRPEHEIGAHVGGQNSGKIGICCIGGLNRATGPNKGVDNRTPEQIESLIALIRDIKNRHPNAVVVGHRDLAATQCPGFDARVWWAKVENAPIPAPTPVAPDAPVKTPELDEDDWHVVEKGETWFGIAREHGIPQVALLAYNRATDRDTLQVGQRLAVTAQAAASLRPASNSPKPAPAAPEPASGDFWARLIRAIGRLIFGRS